jgi:hypothetical protein
MDSQIKQGKHWIAKNNSGKSERREAWFGGNFPTLFYPLGIPVQDSFVF